MLFDLHVLVYKVRNSEIGLRICDVNLRFFFTANVVHKLYKEHPLPLLRGGRRSPAVACWASDHWVASSNPLRGNFRH